MQYFDAESGADLKAAFDDLVADWNGVDAKTMFGRPSYRADGTLFAVLVTDGVALTRLPDEWRSELETVFETDPFQAGDRTVTKWVQVPVSGPTDLDALRPYVRASYETARGESAT
jgi:hypothetical protein